MILKKRALKILTVLRRLYPQSGAVDMGNPRDTLIATLLSARTRDDQVLKMYPAFKKRFPNWDKLADASISSIETAARSVNFYRTKARALKKMAQMIRSEFNGSVPHTMEALIRLPGVGRKTASCVLSFSFSEPAIAVDTHVFRVTRRLGWTDADKPETVERDLMNVVPKKNWNDLNRTIVPFGRDICKPRRPRCSQCPVRDLCLYEDKVLSA